MKFGKRLVFSIFLMLSLLFTSFAGIPSISADDAAETATPTYTSTPTLAATLTQTSTPAGESSSDGVSSSGFQDEPENPPTETPTETPAEAPAEIPTEIPTEVPTETPSGEPSQEPTGETVSAAGEEVTLTPEMTPTATEEAEEVVPLIMPEDTSNIIPGQYIVVYKNSRVDSKKLSTARTKVKEKGGEIKQNFSGRINGFAAKLSKDALKTLRQDPDIDYIEPDQYVTAFDGEVGGQTIVQSDVPSWGLDRIDQAAFPLDGLYHYPTSAGAGVHVYVIDSGIRSTHTDFGGRVLDGVNFVDDEYGTNDCAGHGTLVAGVIGSSTYGVAKSVSLHSVRVLECNGQGPTSDVIAGLEWVIANHDSPAVVNMSLGVPSVSTALNTAVANTVAAGITVVVASGNVDEPEDSENACDWSPASAPSALTIGASSYSGTTDTKASYSTYGGCLDMFAPGSSITTTSNASDSAIASASGTSLASPHVAGAAALYLADNPGASPATVADVLIAQSTKDVISNPGSGSPNRLLSVSSTEMTQVVLASPANGSYINQTGVTLTWLAAYIGDSYEVEVDDSSDFSGPEFSETIEELSVVVTGFVDRAWYWRVRAVNAYGTTGEWSETWTFTVDTVAPDTPVLQSPEDEAVVYGTPEFGWNASDGASLYQFEYNLLDDPETYTYRSDEITTVTHTPPDMATPSMYYWFVRAGDEAGNWSSWSSAFTVTVNAVPAAPTAPALSSPDNSAFTNDSTPELTWNAVDGGVSYHVQIATDSGFGAIVQEQENITELTYTAGELSDGKYYWRVRAKNVVDVFGSWSSVRNFTVDIIAPAVPVLLSPASGSEMIGMPTFTWSASTGAAYYQFEFSTDSDPETYEFRSEEISKTNYKPLTKTLTVEYYWFVRARDAAGNWSVWSEPFTITVEQPIPAKVALRSPANGGLTGDNTPELEWNLVEYSTYYHIQVASDSRFNTIIQEQDDVIGLTYTPDVELPDGRYYWRVRAKNEIGEYGAFSSAWYFTVDTLAPDAPLPYRPLDDGTVTGTPSFAWYTASGAKYYQFEYSLVDSDPENDYVYRSDESKKNSIRPPAMDTMTTYYWFVRAGDAAGNWSGWSAPFTVHIVPPTPSRPSSASPNKGFLTNETSLDLVWNTVDYGDTYHVQVSTSSSFTTIDQEQEAADLSFALSGLSDGIHYWRVRARNANGIYGKWSRTVYFTVDTTPPAAPVLSRPVDGSENVGTPTFIWSRPSTAKYYQFEYSLVDDDPHNSYEYRSEETKKYKFIPPAMDTMTTYYWFVRARDAAGNWSDWSAPYSFTVVAPTPSRPTTVSPAHKSLSTEKVLELSWNAVDYAQSYHVQLSTSSRFSAILQEQADVSGLNLTTIELDDGRYYWRVRAANENGVYGSWSSARYFLVDTIAPSVPILRSPLDTAAFAGTPTFKWYQSSGYPRYYQFEYSTVNDPETYVYRSDELTKYYHKPPAMEAMTTYYWFVRAGDKAGNWSEWSEPFAITIDPAAPGRVSLVSPASRYITAEEDVDLSWNAVDYGYVYQIQLDNSSGFRNPDYNFTSDVEATSKTVGPIDPGKWYWRVRAQNEVGGYGAWSSVRYLTIYPKIDSKFDVDDDLGEWTARSGAAWGVSSGSLFTAGLAGNRTTSISYGDDIFTDFTYDADIKMDAPASGEFNVYGLVLRGTPTIDEWNDWSNGIYFTVKQVDDANYDEQYTCALVYMISSSKWSLLGGSCGEATYDAFNNLKVYANGRTMKFYVNDYLILSKSIRGFSSGNLGIVSWGGSAKTTYVDAAYAGLPEEPVVAGMQIGAQSALPFEVDLQEQFNEIVK